MAYKCEILYNVLVKNLNVITEEAKVDLWGDETMWGHGGFGKAGSGLIRQIWTSQESQKAADWNDQWCVLHLTLGLHASPQTTHKTTRSDPARSLWSKELVGDTQWDSGGKAWYGWLTTNIQEEAPYNMGQFLLWGLDLQPCRSKWIWCYGDMSTWPASKWRPQKKTSNDKVAQRLQTLTSKSML
jgi:hypothetical protein